MNPAVYDRSVLMAVRALFDGAATEGQQKRAMEWIVMNACHIGQPSFAESDRLTSFNEGSRWIGLQIAKLREPEALKQLEAWEAETVKTRALRTKRNEANK